MRNVFLLLSGVLAFSLPLSADARILLNEVAWMGTDEGGANCEWIELFNTSGEIVPLSGWTLVIENPSSVSTIDLGSTANVVYSGIADNGYYLIARSTGSCGTLSPGSSADWKGTFSISNEGAKLTLKHGTETEDTLDASSGWKESGIGGSNTVPKKTAQRAASGWLTDLPTPRGPNREAPLEELPDEDEETGTTTPVVTIGGTAPLVPVDHPVPKLRFAPIASRIVPLGADTAFETFVYDSTGKMRADADVSWSFGDGAREEGRMVQHAYREPGEYLAVVRAKAKGSSVVQTFTVDAVPMDVTVSPDANGVRVSNDSPHLLDLSLWKLKSGKRVFKLPADTVLAAGSSVVLSPDITRLPTSTPPTLLYPSGKVASAYEPEPVSPPEPEVPVVAPATVTAAAWRHEPEEAPESPVVAVEPVRPSWNTLLASMLSFIVP